MATIKLKYSSEVIGGAAKAPSTLERGEVAINNATNYESLFLKNSGNTIIKLPINYLKGVTSDVQTQLNGKSNSNHTHDDRYANKYGNTGNDFSVRELNVNCNGIHFTKYGNDAGGWDGADIYLDNEGNTDKSKLIFKIADDNYDSFSFRVANTNPLNIIDTGITINGDCSISKNLNVTSWLFGKDALFSGGVQSDGGISSATDVRAGNMARFFSNSGVTGWLQLGDGSYKHAVISAMYGNNIDDLEIKAINSNFNGTLHARKAIIDNLNVSGNLNVYSLTSNQTRVTNGDLWIQNSGKIVRVIGIDDNSFNILVEDNVLELDDLCIIHSQRSFNEIVRVSFSVKGESPAINVNNQSYRVYNCTIISGSYLDLVSGDTVVRVGNKSNKSRQSSILHAASFEGNGAATIYYSNVSTLNASSFYPNASYISSAIGDLKALGYGSASIMTNNGHFKGSIETTDMFVTERYRRKTQFIEVDRNVGGIVIDGVATEIRLGELQLPLNDTHIFMRRDAIGLISKLMLVEPNDNEVDEIDGTYIKVTVENTTNQNFIPSIISRDKSGRTYTIQWLPTSVNIKGNRMITFEFKFIKQRHKAPLSYDSGWFVHNVYSNVSQIQ